MEKDLSQLVEKLKQAAASNLKSVVLYGSAAAGEFHPKHSDLNVLCVLDRLDAAALEHLAPVAVWWTRQGQPAPLAFTLEELRNSADMFAIELLDMRAAHRVLYGEDYVSALDVPMSLHAHQVERELRANLVRLRQNYLTAPRHLKTLLELLTASVSSFTTLFRHALIALGVEPPPGKRAVVDRLAQLLQFDGSAFHTVLDVREGKLSESQVDVVKTCENYIAGVAHVASEMDRRLAVA